MVFLLCFGLREDPLVERIKSDSGMYGKEGAEETISIYFL